MTYSRLKATLLINGYHVEHSNDEKEILIKWIRDIKSQVTIFNNGKFEQSNEFYIKGELVHKVWHRTNIDHINYSKGELYGYDFTYDDFIIFL